MRVIVGLEAHDGSGKSTTAVEISKLFNGSVFFKMNKPNENETGFTRINP